MADTSVVAGASRADGSSPYDLGKPNWQTRTIPHIRHPKSTIQIPESRLLDVVILGDGFQTSAEFEAGLQVWIGKHSKRKYPHWSKRATKPMLLFTGTSRKNNARQKLERHYITNQN